MRESHIINSNGRYARYAALGAPLAFASLPLYLHVPSLYSSATPLNLASIGIILLAVRSIDMVVDPFIGSLSDVFQNHRRSIMAAAVPILALGYFALFNPPQGMDRGPTTLWLTASLIVTYAGFSILMINYYAMGVGLASAPHEHTRVALWREGAMLIGVLAASVLPTMLMNTIPLRDAYELNALILAALLAISAFWTLTMRDIRHTPVVARTLPFHLLKNRRLRSALFIVIINAPPLAITSTLFLFYTSDVLGAANQSGLMLGLYFLSAVFGMPMWSRLSVTFGKTKTLILSMLASIGCFIWAAFLGRGDSFPFYIICLLSGMTLGADTVLLPSIFAEELGTAKAELGAGFGWWNFLNKAALAIAAGIALPLLAAGGYRPGTSNTPGALALLSASYALLPCACKIFAAAALYFSPLVQKPRPQLPSSKNAGNKQ